MHTHACTHLLTQSDCLGSTCLLCGETLVGYGFEGYGQNHCRHLFDRIDDHEICWYCSYIRPFNPEEKKIALAIIQEARKTNPQMLALIESWLVAGVSPDNIATIAWAEGHSNSEHWRLAAEYFYDLKI